MKYQNNDKLQNVSASSDVRQAFFFLPNIGLLPILEVVVLDGGSSPRTVAKMPKPRKGKYIYRRSSEALPD